MGTYCLIGILRANGTVDYIYVSSDGYLSGAGESLLLDFDTFEKASALIEGGDRWQLDEPNAAGEPFKTASDLYAFYCRFCDHTYLFKDNAWAYHNRDFLHLRDLVPAMARERAERYL